MNYNVHVFYKMIFSNKFGFILETVFSYAWLAPMIVRNIELFINLPVIFNINWGICCMVDPYLTKTNNIFPVIAGVALSKFINKL
jgi:hypothetical protein